MGNSDGVMVDIAGVGRGVMNYARTCQRCRTNESNEKGKRNRHEIVEVS